MLGSTLYLVGLEGDGSGYVKNANPCSMCVRMIINAGIQKVIVRDDSEHYRSILVEEEWVSNDESLEGKTTYGNSL